MVFNQSATIIVSSLQEMWGQVIGFIPTFLTAIVVFIIGLIVGTGLATVVEKLVSALKIDALLRSLGVETYVERAGLRLNSGRLVGQLVFWFFAIFSFFVATNILGLIEVSDFLKNLLFGYIRNIFGAILIFFGSIILARFLSNLVKASVMSARLHAAKFLSGLTWWTVVVIGFIGALGQLNIAVQVLNTILTGVVVMFALAGGLAFGLGGRDYAAQIIARFREQVADKK